MRGNNAPAPTRFYWSDGNSEDHIARVNVSFTVRLTAPRNPRLDESRAAVGGRRISRRRRTEFLFNLAVTRT